MKKSLIMIMIAIVALMVSCEPLHVDDLPHSITYTLDGGYWTEEAPITSAVFNNRVILPVCEKRGYTLTGWKSEQVKVEGTTETEFSFIMPAEDAEQLARSGHDDRQDPAAFAVHFHI